MQSAISRSSGSSSIDELSVKKSATKKGSPLSARPQPAKTQRCALIFACHPDDAEIGMGGTIAAMVNDGVRVVIADLSDGEPTPFGSKAIRARETKAASNILGVSERITVGLKNREIFDNVEARKKAAGVIRKYQPDILFSHFREDSHPDHVAASALVDAARFYAKFVKSDLPYEPCFPRKIFYFHAMHLKTTIEPSFVVDISTYHRTKMRSIEAYASQFSHHPGNKLILAQIRTADSNWGRLIGVSHAEPFTVRETLKIAGTEAFFNG